MSDCRLYVGNLPYSIDDAGLRDLFSKFGEVVDVKVIIDFQSNRSKGFGFVTFADKSAGDKAVSEMDGTEIDGRKLKVNEARERRT